MLRDVHKVIERCAICKKAKGKENAYGLYMSLAIPEQPWMDVSIDFCTWVTKNTTWRGFNNGRG